MERTSSVSRHLSPLTWLAAIIAGCGGLLGWQALRLAGRQAPGRGSAAVRPDGDEPPAARPRTRPAARPPSLSLVAPGGQEPAPGAEKTPEQVRQESVRRTALIEKVLRSEPIDAAWGPAAERSIAEVLAGDASLKGHRLISAQCRSTLCRVETSHGSRSEGSRLGALLPTRLPALPSGTMRIESRGAQDFRTVIYFARAGHHVPRLPEE